MSIVSHVVWERRLMSAVPASRGARAVLRAPWVPRLLFAGQVGRLPLGSAPIALLLFARQSSSLTMAGLVVAAYTAGMAAGTPLLARGVDRWSQRPVLHGSVALSTAGFLTVALSGGRPIAALIGAALAGLGTPPLEACLRVLWPGLVPADTVSAAYALDVALQELIFVAGPVISLAAAAITGPSTAVLTAAGLQLAGALYFASAAPVRRWRGARAQWHWAGPLRVPRFAALIGGMICVGAAVGSIPVALTGYAEVAADRSIAAWLIAAQAAGALTGGLLYTRARPGGGARLTRLSAALALGFVPLISTPPPGPMAVLMVVSGLALPPVLTVVFLLADRLAPEGAAAEAFAWIATAFAVGSATGAALNGPLTTLEPRYGFAFAPLAAALAVAVMLPATRRTP
jgi:predicted MFS family arabinose efflux permease